MTLSKFKKNFIYFIAIYFSSLAHAKYIPDVISPKNLEEVAQSAIEYSLQDQVRSADDKFYLNGEFRTKIQSSLIPALVGVGKAFGQDDEASAFTTAAVVNQMAQLYLDNPHLHQTEAFKKIPEAISLATKTYDRYKSGETYNFYPPYQHESGVMVRRPINMTLFSLWHGFTNIPNDSDTSSSVLLSLVYNSKINKTDYEINQEALDQFSAYLDVNRNPMYYNKFEKRKKTGAFMTWLMNEKDQKMPRFYFASSKDGARIPFNKNDVDCVVNTNIIKMLTATQKEIPGLEASCRMINDMIHEDENATCGIYYPNTYNLASALAEASQLGSTCLQNDNKLILVKKVLNEQNEDGSWTNIKNIWTDEILSTAFALRSLMEFGDLQDPKIKNSVFKGLQYLFLQAKMKKGLIYWPEDHFFTATAIARSLIMWKSKAYTNTLIASVLLKAHKNYPELKVSDYLDHNKKTSELSRINNEY